MPPAGQAENTCANIARILGTAAELGQGTASVGRVAPDKCGHQPRGTLWGEPTGAGLDFTPGYRSPIAAIWRGGVSNPQNKKPVKLSLGFILWTLGDFETFECQEAHNVTTALETMLFRASP